jgi:DNA-binding MarR family transcriptional regulator
MKTVPAKINDVIHGRVRLTIMAYLSSVNPAEFTELIAKTETTNGNLSTHLTRLETAGFIRQEKGYKGKRPQTLIFMTDTGREAWITYLTALQDLLGDSLKAAQ